jgi:hypothetical protein
MIDVAFCILPFSVYSRKTSSRSRSFDCSSWELAREQAWMIRSLACRIAFLADFGARVSRGVLSIRPSGVLAGYPCFLFWLKGRWELAEIPADEKGLGI